MLILPCVLSRCYRRALHLCRPLFRTEIYEENYRNTISYHRRILISLLVAIIVKIPIRSYVKQIKIFSLIALLRIVVIINVLLGFDNLVSSLRVIDEKSLHFLT